MGHGLDGDGRCVRGWVPGHGGDRGAATHTCSRCRIHTVMPHAHTQYMQMHCHTHTDTQYIQMHCHTHTHTRTHTRTRTYTHTHTLTQRVMPHTHTHTHIHTQSHATHTQYSLTPPPSLPPLAFPPSLICRPYCVAQPGPEPPPAPPAPPPCHSGAGCVLSGPAWSRVAWTRRPPPWPRACSAPPSTPTPAPPGWPRRVRSRRAV